MDLVQKYSIMVRALIEEAKAEGITIGSYVDQVNDIIIEQGIAVICDDKNFQTIPTWKR